MTLTSTPSSGFSRPREAILLVAGTGTRLHPLTENCPKCLLDVGGISLLERLTSQLVQLGIKRVVLATGFMNDHLVEKVRRFGLPLEVEEAFCESFARENNAVSLAKGMEKLQSEHFLLCDGDILLRETSPLEGLLNLEAENALSMIRFEEMGAEEMKIQLNDQGRIEFLSKELPPQTAQGESLGIQKIGPSAFGGLRKRLAALNEEERRRLYYEDVFAELIQEGVEFSACEFPRGCWTEIDTIEDLETARAMAEQWEGA